MAEFLIAWCGGGAVAIATMQWLIRRDANKSRTYRLLCDGHGSHWPMCDRPDCELHVVRPGVARCYRCEEEDDRAE